MYITNNNRINPAAAADGIIPATGAPPTAAEMAIVGFIIVVTLYFGQVVFVPLALAVILSFVLAPGIRLLKRAGLPNAPSVILVVFVAFAIIFGVGALITQQVGTLAKELPRYQITLKEKIVALREATAGSGGAFQQASDTLKDLQKQLETPSAGAGRAAGFCHRHAAARAARRQRRAGGGKPIPVELHAPAPTPLDQLQTIIGIVLEPLATFGAVLLFVLFLLLQREDVRDRAIRLMGSHDLEKSTTAMDDAGDRLSKYFLGMTAINAGFGLLIGVGLWLIGVPSPVLWGVLAMLMRFVPFIGSFIAAACPLMLAAAVDPGWSMFLWTLALYAISEPIMGSVIEPLVQSHRTGLSPLAIVLAAAFWTLLWGPIGLLLAIPLTVVLVVLGRHVERLEFLNVVLGDSPPLSPPERFYQRMLAGDPAEAVEQAEKYIKECPLIDYYDEVVIEGLRLAQADSDRGTLDPSRLADIRDTADIVINSLADQDVLPNRKAQAAKAAEENGGRRTADCRRAGRGRGQSRDRRADADPAGRGLEGRQGRAVRRQPHRARRNGGAGAGKAAGEIRHRRHRHRSPSAQARQSERRRSRWRPTDLRLGARCSRTQRPRALSRPQAETQPARCPRPRRVLEARPGVQRRRRDHQEHSGRRYGHDPARGTAFLPGQRTLRQRGNRRRAG